MKIIVSQKDIGAELNSVNALVSLSKSLSNITPGIQITATTENKVIISAYNSRESVEIITQAKVINPGAVVIANGYAFQQLITTLKNKEITMELDSKRPILNLTTENGSYTVPIYSHKDGLNNIFGTELDSKIIVKSSELLNMIKNISKVAAQNNPKRPILEGILLSIDNNQLVLSATDSYRAAIVFVSLIQGDCLGCVGVLHSRSLGLLLKMTRLILAEEELIVHFTKSSKHIVFEVSGKMKLSCALLGEGSKFPDVRTAIPKTSTVVVGVSRDELLDTIKRVSLFLEPMTETPITMNITDLGVINISVATAPSTIGTGTESLVANSVENFPESEDYQINIMSKFFIDGLMLFTAPNIKLILTQQGTAQVLAITEDISVSSNKYILMGHKGLSSQ